MATTKAFKSSLQKAMEAIAVSAFLTENSEDGRGGVPVMLLGNPGAAKSAFVETFARLMGYEFLNVEAASRTPEDFLGFMATPDNMAGDDHVEPSIILPDYYVRLKKWVDEGKKVILFFDEINTAPQFVQSVALGLIQERRFKDIKLPNTVTIVAAGNYFENINQDDMQPMAPILNRFCIINIHTEVDMSGNDDLAVLQKVYESIENSDHQYSFKEAYADTYQDILMNISTKALTEESEDEKSIRWSFESAIAKGVINVVRRLQAVDKKIDINDKRLSNLYSDAPTPDHDVYNFLSLRSLAGLIKMSGGYFRLWGIDSVQSDSFADVINGLVGLSVAPRPNTKATTTLDDAKYVLIGEEFFSEIKNICKTFKVKSDKKIDKKLKIFSSFLQQAEDNAKGTGKKKVISLSETVFHEVKEYLSGFRNEVKDVNKPIEEKSVCRFFDYLLNVPKVDENYQLPITTSGSSTVGGFATFDKETQLEYANSKAPVDYKHWLDWWSVVQQFVLTFGDSTYGYQSILPLSEITKLQNKAINFFNTVQFTIKNDTELSGSLDAQSKPLFDRLTRDVIKQDFSLDDKCYTYLFRNSQN